jgi:3D-(3,5/4)-trihydroxycyclohexane-1,2-dione acylhydrolase (decyclizing)
MDRDALTRARLARAQAIQAAGGIDQGLAAGTLPRRVDVTLSEAVVLGLIRQNVRSFVGIFGHGSTEMGEVLRVYESAGVVKSYGVRNETEATHAACALRWVTGEKACVYTSIGPGALNALAGSLVAASNGLGVYFMLGDETTEDEGANMQQIPKHEQDLYLQLFATMGAAYNLHTPLAVGTALRRGLNAVEHPYRQGPFYMLLPMNEQSVMISQFNLDELPVGAPPPMGAASDNGRYDEAADKILAAERVVLRVGGGGRYAGPELLELLELADGVSVVSPVASGAIPFWHPRNMTLAGSKGSLCGNYATEEADLVIAIGTRGVCQSDSSRTAFIKAKQIININGDLDTATHYNQTLALVGDIRATLAQLNAALKRRGSKGAASSAWFTACTAKRRAWDAFRQSRYDNPTLYDERWGAKVLTQPAAIKAATDWARAHDVVTFFDAGDVQANGMQICEDDNPYRTYTDTGASYMGFAVSALLSTALTKKPFYGLAVSGDGSFTMTPQILFDGVRHGAKGCILLLDNRAMGAIVGLQTAQYGVAYTTTDNVETDYVKLASAVKGVLAMDGGNSTASLLQALDRAKQHDGLSLIHVRAYGGPDPMGNLGAFGRWNVGNWCDDTQALRHQIGL